MEAVGLLVLAASIVIGLGFGYPVAFTLGGMSLLVALVFSAFGHFDMSFAASIPSRIQGIVTNELFVAIPLFVFLGVILEKSKIAEELLSSMAQLFGGVRCGLGISVTLVGALLAASTGIVGASVVTMGLLSLPSMLRYKYEPALACGTICAAGTLGQIIPPSVVLIILADQVSAAYQEAQMKAGNFAADPVSVLDLFAGAMIPGLLLVAVYIAWQVAYSFIFPNSAPPLPLEERKPFGPELVRHLLKALVAPLFLIVAVLGSILMGIATPTEGAAVGAFGGTLLALARRQIPVAALREVMQSTVRLSAMIFAILIGAAMFSLVFRGFNGDELIGRTLSSLPGGAVGALILVNLVIFGLGFIIDFIEIVFIVIPIVAPAIFGLGVDPIWFSILVAVNLQTSFLTPPFGFALFYLRGVAPPQIQTSDIYRGIIPFVILQLGVLILVGVVPALATWLPKQIYQ